MCYLSTHSLTVQIFLFSMILALIATPIPSPTTDVTGSLTQTVTRKRKKADDDDVDNPKIVPELEGAKSNAKKATLRWYKLILARRLKFQYLNQTHPLVDRETWTVAIVEETNPPAHTMMTFRTYSKEEHGARAWQVRSRERDHRKTGFKIILTPPRDHTVLARIKMTALTRLRLMRTMDLELEKSGWSSTPNLLFLDQMLRAARREVERLFEKEPKEFDEQVLDMDFTNYTKWTDEMFPKMLHLNGTAEGQIIDCGAMEWEQQYYDFYKEFIQLIETGKGLYADPMEWVKKLDEEILAIPKLSEAQMDELIEQENLKHQVGHCSVPVEKPH
ncbi:hypothetical protein C8R42DRAFT_657206 [Lentinula raphanica]|nr:hypothetical protein C8R42DRAFT_657206 [Lentinula raphanica]